MKKGIFLTIGIFIATLSINAANLKSTENYYKNRSVNFVENGIAFTVFTNGSFNYDTNVFLHRNERRFRQNIIIDRDYLGRIAFINNIPIRYNNRDRVTRIGDVTIRYNRGRIINVGYLDISYNRYGEPIFFGSVRRNNINLNIYSGRICNYNDPFFFRNDFRRSYAEFRRDRNFIYYRNNANKVIRRRLASNLNRQNNAFKKRNNNNNVVRRNTTVVRRNTNINRSNRNTTVIKKRTVVKNNKNKNRNNTKRKPDARRRS